MSFPPAAGLAWIVPGALGGALAAAHTLLPPGHPAAAPVTVLGEGAGDPRTWLAFALLLLVALAAPRLLRYLPLGFERACVRALERALRPLWASLAIVGLLSPLERLWFRCPLPALAFGAATIGLLASLWRLLALRPRDALPPPAWLLAAATLMLLLPLVGGWPGVQGDEPHYLLVAGSLLDDLDLDVADDYGEAEYAAYHPAPLSPHYKPGTAAGSRYSMHGVGYPLALLPAQAAARAIGVSAPLAGRALQALLFAFFVALLYRALRDSLGARAALLGTLGTAWLSPFVFAPLHLFPETAVMTAGLLGFTLAADRRVAPWRAGIWLALLPWLAVKTIPLALVLGAGGAWVGVPGSAALRRGARVLAPLAAALLAHAAFTWTLYGSPSPSAIYLGADPAFARLPGYGTDLAAYLADWPGALRTAVGYLVDQKEGLLFTGPHWLFAVLGFGWLWRHRRRHAIALGLALLAYVGPYALSQQIGGQSPPARPLMGVAWILAWPLGVGLARLARGPVAALRGALVVAAVAITLRFVADPTLLPHDYPVTASWLLRSLSPQGWELHRAFPWWLNVRGAWPWAVALAWLAALAGLAVACLKGAGPLPSTPGRPDRAGWAGATAGALAVVLVGGWAAALVVTDRHRGAEVSAGLTVWVRYALPEVAWAESSGAWVSAGGEREVVVTGAPSFGALELSVRSLVPGAIRIGGGAEWKRVELGDDRWSEALSMAPEGGENRRGPALLALVAERDASPAELSGGEDHRRLGALLRVRRAE